MFVSIILTISSILVLPSNQYCYYCNAPISQELQDPPEAFELLKIGQNCVNNNHMHSNGMKIILVQIAHPT